MSYFKIALLGFAISFFVQSFSLEAIASEPNRPVMSEKPILVQENLPKAIIPFQSDETIIWNGPSTISTYEIKPDFYISAQSGVLFVRIDPYISLAEIKNVLNKIETLGAIIVGQRPQRVELQLFVNSDSDTMQIYQTLKNTQYVIGVNLNMLVDTD